MSKLFINRQLEFTEIKEDFLNWYDISVNSKIFLIHSISGLGKSSLTKKILDSISPEIFKVKLSISKSRSEFHQDGYYIRELAKKIAYESSKDRKFSYLSFREYKESLPKATLSSFLNNILNDYAVKEPIVKNIIKEKNNLKEYEILDFDKIFSSNLSEATIQ